MNKVKIIVCLICLGAVMVPANISGELSGYQYEIIELAFSNGFLKGMSIDEDIIKELMKDKEKLNDFVREHAREYMDTVIALNMTDHEKRELEKEKSKEKKPPKANNSIRY